MGDYDALTGTCRTVNGFSIHMDRLQYLNHHIRDLSNYERNARLMAGLAQGEAEEDIVKDKYKQLISDRQQQTPLQAVSNGMSMNYKGSGAYSGSHGMIGSNPATWSPKGALTPFAGPGGVQQRQMVKKFMFNPMSSASGSGRKTRRY
jgi:hypothetical protein